MPGVREPTPRPRQAAPARATSTIILSALMVLVGIALIVRTLAAGGGGLAVGLLLGILFVLAGGGRIYLQRRMGA